MGGARSSDPEDRITPSSIFEEPPSSSKKSNLPPPPVFRPIFDPFFGTEDRRLKIEGGSSIFEAEDPRLKVEISSIFGAGRSNMGGSSIFGSEDRRNGSSSKIEALSKNLSHLRRTPLFEETLHILLRPRKSKNPPSSIFGSEDWVEDRHRPRSEKVTQQENSTA